MGGLLSCPTLEILKVSAIPDQGTGEKTREWDPFGGRSGVGREASLEILSAVSHLKEM